MPDTNPRYTAEVKLLEKLRDEILNRKKVIYEFTHGSWQNGIGASQFTSGDYDPLNPESVRTFTFKLKGKDLSENGGVFLRRKSDFYLDFILFDYRFLVKDRYEFVINGGKSLVAPSYDMDLSYYVPDRELYKEALLEKLRDVYIEKNRELPKNLLLPLPATRVTSVQVCNTKSNRVIEDFNAHDVLHQALTQREIEYLEPLAHSSSLMEIYQEVMQRGSAENIEMILKAISK